MIPIGTWFIDINLVLNFRQLYGLSPYLNQNQGYESLYIIRLFSYIE